MSGKHIIETDIESLSLVKIFNWVRVKHLASFITVTCAIIPIIILAGDALYNLGYRDATASAEKRMYDHLLSDMKERMNDFKQHHEAVPGKPDIRLEIDLKNLDQLGKETPLKKTTKVIVVDKADSDEEEK